MFVKTIKPTKEIKLTNGVGIKNLGSNNARLGLTLPADVKVLKNNNHNNKKAK
jgi:hypothetical protein